ncbi:MAG: hypothetical protein EHM51_01180 [Geobacter sp.]|nr:MAG: hypothetical protein EHM51_01180 [Geobacter sp.]
MSKLVSATIFMPALLGLMVSGCGGGGGDENVATYTISGKVTPLETGKQRTTVILGGTGNATAFTNSSGNYVFNGLANGNYTITPYNSGYTYTPKVSTQVINGASISSVNFLERKSSPIFYVVDEFGNLGTVNILSGDVLVIGNTGVVMYDIASDPNGNLYGVSSDKLYKIDKSSAASTPVGSLNTFYLTSLVFSNDGSKLYAADQYLYKVNTATGAATATTSTGGFQYQSSGDLVFIGNQLYLTSRIANSLTDTYLVRLDTLTGAGTLVGSVGCPDVFGMASNDKVHLYGFSGSKVIGINIDTGVGSLLWEISGKGLGSIYGAASD